MKMIRKANKTDIDWMVEMSYQKRLNYSKKQKIFWKISENSDEIQKKYFEKELKNKNVIALIYQEKQGFVMGKLISPPEVYDAGLTLMIDDFCVKSDDLWLTIGKELLNECQREAKIMNAKQILVVCGDHDRQKFLLLETMNMRVASRWYTKTI
jgi:N-acetylglutamate synthase-like GNAT family acetyltransferase